MKNIFLLLIFISFFSCEEKKENLLIGNWCFDERLKNEDYDSFDEEIFGLNIINDSVLEYKFGFYEDVPTLMKVINFDRRNLNMKINALSFLGTKTKYKVKDSTLLFWDKSDSIWVEYKIKKSNQKNLILEDQNQKEYNLTKTENNYNNSTLYDAIIVDREGGFGCCGINTTYINRKGEMYFKGLGYNTNEEDFKTQLDLKTVTQIFDNFDKMNILKMDDSYQRSATDAQNNSISFIKNGKIVKSIQDYANKVPLDFFAAYNELSYLYQKVKKKNDIIFLFDNRVHFPSFENKIVQNKIYNSELFLLELELIKGKASDISFEPKYSLNFSNLNQGFIFNKIETDGRYYKFIYKNNTSKTIDIGYNFIEINPIIKLRQ
jgi:hypothetical protein